MVWGLNPSSRESRFTLLGWQGVLHYRGGGVQLILVKALNARDEDHVLPFLLDGILKRIFLNSVEVFNAFLSNFSTSLNEVLCACMKSYDSLCKKISSKFVKNYKMVQFYDMTNKL
jgi:hypothetical protein